MTTECEIENKEESKSFKALAKTVSTVWLKDRVFNAAWIAFTHAIFAGAEGVQLDEESVKEFEQWIKEVV